MRIEIRNILGVTDARIEIPEGGIVEVAGPNAAGKSSVAAAVQAVLAHDANPLGIPAAQAKRVYLHEGADYGEAVLYGDAGVDVTTWRPAAGTIESPVDPSSCPEAVGLVDFTARAGAKQRAEQIQTALLPPPEDIRGEVRRALTDYLDPDDLEGVLTMIIERGFEAAAEVYADRARRAKQEWREVTGATWGIKVGFDWQPAGWQASYDSMTVQQAEERVIAARDALSVLHSVKAVSEAEVQQAREERERLPALEAKLAALVTAQERAIAERQAIDVGGLEREAGRLEGVLDSLSRTQECPHCQEPLTVEGGEIVAAYPDASGPAIEETRGHLKRIRRLQAASTAGYDTATQNIRNADTAVSQARADLLRAQDLSAKADAEATPDMTAALANAEAEVEAARDVVTRIRASEDAARLHQTIVRYSEAAKAIGPQGVRQRMLADGLRSLNAGLRRISQMTGWAPMEVDERGGMTWATRPVQMASESERWRAQASMQLTLGAMSEARAVVLDRVDILDDRARLAKALKTVAESTGLGIMICATETAANPAWWPVVRIEDGRTAA